MTEILEELGEKHIQYGVTPDMYPVMGVALCASLTKMLGEDKFDSTHRAAFERLYGDLAGDMIRGHNRGVATVVKRLGDKTKAAAEVGPVSKKRGGAKGPSSAPRCL